MLLAARYPCLHTCACMLLPGAVLVARWWRLALSRTAVAHTVMAHMVVGGGGLLTQMCARAWAHRGASTGARGGERARPSIHLTHACLRTRACALRPRIHAPVRPCARCRMCLRSPTSRPAVVTRRCSVRRLALLVRGEGSSSPLPKSSSCIRIRMRTRVLRCVPAAVKWLVLGTSSLPISNGETGNYEL